MDISSTDATTTLYMVRHAESPFIFGEERTRPLSERGLSDARTIAVLLSHIPIHAIVSSPYTRAIQTVQYLAEDRGLRIAEHEELKERAIKGLDYPISERELFNGIKQSFEDIDFAMEGGESTRAAQKRAIPLIESLVRRYRGQAVAVGTHGNIMTIIMKYYDDKYGFDFWSSTSKPDVYKLVFGDEMKLESVERLWLANSGE
jgi:2,3-bisphosphoglycerate-dependent phosphoglycerate mutase